MNHFSEKSLSLAVALLWPFRILILLLTVWCTGAIWYQRWVTSPAGKFLLIILFTIAELALFVLSFRKQLLLVPAFFLPTGIMIAWFLLLRPTGKRDWDPPFIRMTKVKFTEDEKYVTIENIRDFHYRSERDYDIRYRTETYCLDDLETLDYSITHWNRNTLFGHIILSFGFKDGRRLAFSPEARLERGELYELLPGFYRHYELIFIPATEEDVFTLRTHHRKYEEEEVFLYPVRIPKKSAIFILKDLLRRAEALADHPEFYNGITYNCLSSMAPTAEKIGIKFCSGWHGTFNGITDGIAYRNGWIIPDKPGEKFEDYKKRHSINQYVEKLTDPPDYSELIRTGWPSKEERTLR